MKNRHNLDVGAIVCDLGVRYPQYDTLLKHAYRRAVEYKRTFSGVTPGLEYEIVYEPKNQFCAFLLKVRDWGGRVFDAHPIFFIGSLLLIGLALTFFIGYVGAYTAIVDNWEHDLTFWPLMFFTALFFVCFAALLVLFCVAIRKHCVSKGGGK